MTDEWVDKMERERERERENAHTQIFILKKKF